jgi:hypothetical protein
LRRAGTGEIEGCTNRLVTKCTARAGSVRVSPETFETRVNPDSKLAEDRDRRHQEEQGPDKRCARTIRASHHITSHHITSHHLEARKQHSKPDRDQVGRLTRSGKRIVVATVIISIQPGSSYELLEHIYTLAPLSVIAHSRTPTLHHATRSTRATSHLCDSNRSRLDHRYLSRFD